MEEPSVSLLLYMLHDTAKASPRSHYIGVCRPDQFKRRMREHGAMNASNTTRDMIRKGAHLVVAAVWPIETYSFERTVKRSGHFARSCPICRNVSDEGRHARIDRGDVKQSAVQLQASHSFPSQQKRRPSR